MKSTPTAHSIIPRSNRGDPAAGPVQPVILIALNLGSLEIVDVQSRQRFKMPTVLRVGSAADLMKHCPFSHPRVAVDDAAVAAEMLQAALRTCGLVHPHRPTVFVIRPQPEFVANLAKSELQMLTDMVRHSGFAAADIQFLLKDSLNEEDWHYLERLQFQAAESPSGNGGMFGGVFGWMKKNL